MNLKVNKKKILIIIIILIIILLLIIMLLLINKRNNKANNNITDIDYYNKYQEQRAAQGVTASDAVASLEDNVNQYYAVESIIKNFNSYVSYLNNTAENLGLIVSDSERNVALQEYKQDGINAINDMLANNYKVKYSVNDDYIYKALSKYSTKKYTIDDMYIVKDSDYINTYFIYGNYEGEEYNFIIILDKYRYTFEIYLNNYFKDGKYSKSNTASMKTLNIEKIEKNDNNSFQYKNISQEENANIYFKDYLKKINNNSKEAYDLLDNEYKEKRFKSLESFNTYVNVINNVPYSRRLVKYKISKKDNYTEYICQDNFGNNFIFKVTSVMKYTVVLDAYTVSVDSYNEEYNTSIGTKKAQLCLNRFIEAVNNKDYESAYNFLNNTYKLSNFKTMDEFKSYVENNWFGFNTFSYEDVESDGQNYIIKGTISDTTKTGYNEKYISKTFIVKLGTSIRDFQISFEK